MRKLFTFIAVALLALATSAQADTNWWSGAANAGAITGAPSSGMTVHFETTGTGSPTSAVLDLRQCGSWSATMFVSTPGSVINVVQVADPSVSGNATYQQLLGNDTGTDLDGDTAGLIGIYGVQGVGFIIVDTVTPNGGGGDISAVTIHCGK